MILDILVAIVVAIIAIGGSYAYQKRSRSEEILILKESYKESLLSGLNKSMEKIKGIEQLKSTATAGLQNLKPSTAGQNLDVEELKNELRKEIEEEFKDKVSSRSQSGQKSKNNVGQAVEETRIRREDLQDSEHSQNRLKEGGVRSGEPEMKDEEDEDEAALDLGKLSIDEEQDSDEEDFGFDEDGEYYSDSEDEEWIAELSKDIENGKRNKVDLQRDLKNNEFSVEELEKELEDSYKKLKDFAK